MPIHESQYIGAYTGRICGPMYSMPSPMDFAVSLGRICRWSGNGVLFYPVILHSMAVADLLPKRLKFHGLKHDVTEQSMGDVPRPFKNDEYKQVEDVYAATINLDLGFAPLSDEDALLVRRADDAMLGAEVWAGVGPWCLKRKFPVRDRNAEAIVLRYVEKYPILECVNPGGLAVAEFLRRWDIYKEDAKA